ncbi:hypothetical protein Glove_266g32 [Diversispora epigaea]|uniref:TLDc domain-containing protein n=1 Tax=Diversispora epigaea TaxID=1348612 RepID=A0A397I985_9GLOM|nr:hypothetical protein Glove_266g32 [Diversispora epigaea]
MSLNFFDKLSQNFIELLNDRDDYNSSISARIFNVILQSVLPLVRESFSTIISEERAAEISTWIGRKTNVYTLAYIPYKFELILHGTQDRFAPQTFWNICYGHASSVVLLKVKGTDEIIGGYNPLGWDNSNINNNGWKQFNSFWMYSMKSDFTLDDYCFCSSYNDFYEKPIRPSSWVRFSIIMKYLRL